MADKNSLMFKDHFFTSSDFTAIAYVISNAQHQCVRKVVFDKCTIGMEGVEILAKKFVVIFHLSELCVTMDMTVSLSSCQW